MSTPPASLKLFCSYAREDENLRDQLETHLKPLMREGAIEVWHDGDLTGGQEWDTEIKEQLGEADIILLLISPDFLASDYIHAVEGAHAMERHAAGTARVVPVILRPCDWKGSRFSRLHALPEHGQPITRWPDRDEAFLNVLEGIRKIIDKLAASPNRRPPRSATPKPPPPANIPRPPVFGFVARRDGEGRDIVTRLKEELAPGRNRLVTLSGPGGIGKTTLAAEATRGLHEAYAGRIVWSSADARADFTLQTLLDDIATQLQRPDLRQLAPDAKAEQVRALVGDPPALVVLDNYETIPPPAQKSVEEWFAHAPCPALFTSRPRVAETLPIQVSAMSPAEAEEFLGLLVGHTQVPDVFSDEVRRQIYETAEANPFVMKWVVAQIGAAQVPDAVLEELKQGEGDAAERVFERSFNLPQLGDDGRAALLALSLFAPSASREALAEVAGFGEDRRRLNEAAKNMHGLWLVRAVDNNRRLAFEGLTRSLTAARLSKDERAAAFRQRFVAHFLAYAEAHRQRTAEDFNALEAEKDNLISAQSVAFEGQDWPSVIGINFALVEFLNVRGHWGEAVNMSGQALRAALLSKDEASVAGISHNLAFFYQNRGELTDARRLYAESLEIYRRLGDEHGASQTLHHQAMLAQAAGELGEARRLYDESLEIKKKLGDQQGVSQTLHNLAVLARDTGELGEARPLYAESLKIKKKLGDQDGIAGALHELGRLAQDTGELSEARRLYGESLEISKRLGNQRVVASTLHELGRLAQNAGEFGEARRLYAESLEIKKRLGDQQGTANTLHQLGNLSKDTGEVEEARRLYVEVMEIYQRLGDRQGIAGTLHQLGMLAHRAGELGEARRLYDESLEINRRVGDQRAVAGTLHELGRLACKTREWEEARRFGGESLEIKKRLGDQDGIASTLMLFGAIEEIGGNAAAAAQSYREALSIFERLKSPYAENARRGLKRVESKSS